MQRALEALLSHIVDYAGIFPPANLRLDEAWRNHLRYRNEPEAWLLGRFICPAARLAELGVCTVSDKNVRPKDAAPIALCVLGRGGQSAQEYFTNVKIDLADIGRLHEMHPGQFAADVYEVRLPAKAFAPVKSNQIASLIATTLFLLQSSSEPRLTPFFEAPHNDRESLLALIQAVHDDRHNRPTGFKLRTGGVEASAFPATDLVALAVAACRAAEIPFKATAGLHQPLCHFDPALGVKIHGFVNLFAAGCFAWKQALDQTQLRAILEEEDAKQFRLDEGGLHWRELDATPDDITAARHELVLSFGSCSFDEPRQYLQELGWLP